uniref:Uncharacterized protein n=1 Tax=Ciona intestinalis TaxID=7719 RepID=H2XL33_CIOIN
MISVHTAIDSSMTTRRQMHHIPTAISIKIKYPMQEDPNPQIQGWKANTEQVPSMVYQCTIAISPTHLCLLE